MKNDNNYLYGDSAVCPNERNHMIGDSLEVIGNCTYRCSCGCEFEAYDIDCCFTTKLGRKVLPSPAYKHDSVDYTTTFIQAMLATAVLIIVTVWMIFLVSP